jgi:putative transposase
MTSKMCSICGNIKEDLGGNETYKCQKCGTCIERDINGARNIYIKAIRN